MKIKPGNIAPSALLLAKGRALFIAGPNGWHAQKWPKKRGAAKSGYDWYRQQEFGVLAKMASNPLDLDYGTALEMSKGTEQVPRDILQMCAFGRYYVIKDKDGFEWPNYRDVTNNPQYILNLLDPEPGAVIVYTEAGWIAVPPGNVGDALIMRDGYPQWTPVAGSGGGYAWATNSTGTLDQTAHASKLENFTLVQPVVLATYIPEINPSADIQVKISLWYMDDDKKLLQKLRESDVFECPSGVQTRPIWNIDPIQLIQGQNYGIITTRVGGSGTAALAIYTSQEIRPGLPWQTSPHIYYINSADPQTGNQATLITSPAAGIYSQWKITA